MRHSPVSRNRFAVRRSAAAVRLVSMRMDEGLGGRSARPNPARDPRTQADLARRVRGESAPPARPGGARARFRRQPGDPDVADVVVVVVRLLAARGPDHMGWRDHQRDAAEFFTRSEREGRARVDHPGRRECRRAIDVVGSCGRGVTKRARRPVRSAAHAGLCGQTRMNVPPPRMLPLRVPSEF
jgi:hypothetical protein